MLGLMLSSISLLLSISCQENAFPRGAVGLFSFPLLVMEQLVASSAVV